MSISRERLFISGVKHITLWCSLNGVKVPSILEQIGDPEFATCAYYRDGIIRIWVQKCAIIGRGGRAWSYPGYSVDRTPYGVLAHELGHHVDKAHGARGGIMGPRLVLEANEKPLTGYTDNLNEVFAEHFRLFVTNPDLHNLIRPRTFIRLFRQWPHLAERRKWQEVITEERQFKAAQNKIKQEEKNMTDQVPLSGIFEKLS